MMASVEVFQENPPSVPMLQFPSRIRKYVRLTGPQAYESVNSLVNEVSGSKILSSSQGETLTTKMRLDGIFGASVTVNVISEEEVSAIDFVFSYRSTISIAFIVSIIIISLGLLVFKNILTVVGFALVIPLIFNANNSAVNFLEVLNKTLLFIENEVAQKALSADRERWKAQPKNTEDLYRRLSEKHVKTCGNTKVLEYKIAEYKIKSLTREEAIRKTAEEEGIN